MPWMFNGYNYCRPHVFLKMIDRVAAHIGDCLFLPCLRSSFT